MVLLGWLAWIIAFIGAVAVLLSAGYMAVSPRNCYGYEYATGQHSALCGGVVAAVVGSVAGALL